MNIFDLNLYEVMEFTVSPLQLFIRGTLMFWFLFLIFRLVLRRDVGSASISDFLFVVILGDAAQNAMIGEATSVSDGMALIITLVFWNHLIDVLAYRFPLVERLVSSRKLCLVRDGKMLRRNMRKEFVTLKELNQKLREEGIEDIKQVRVMYMEANGEISVLKRDDAAISDAAAPKTH